MEILKNMFSSSVIVGMIFFAINIYLYEHIKHSKITYSAMKKKKKSLKLNFILLILFFILIIPVNLKWIEQEKYTFFKYYHFMYTLLFTFAVAKLSIKLIIDKLLQRYLSTSQIFYDILKGILYFIAVMILLNENNVPISSLFTTSAILTAILGLALQNTLSDIVAGLIINTEDTIQKGDWIEYDGKIGEVKEFSWRYTKILTLENEFLIIPNKNLTSNDLKLYVSDNIKNFSYIEFGVSYDNMPNKIINIASEAIKSIDDILDFKIFFKGYGDSSIDFEVAFKLKTPLKLRKTKSDIYTMIFYALKRNNIEIPYPKRDIYIKKNKNTSMEDKHNEIKNFLKTIEILKPLKEKELDVVIKNIKVYEYAKDEYILKQGEESSKLYYIYSGEVSVLVNGNKVATLNEKKFFGEISLMTGEKTTADIKAITDTTLYVINNETFHKIFKQNEKLIDSISTILLKRKESLDETLKKKTPKEKKIEEEKLTNKIRNFFTI